MKIREKLQIIQKLSGKTQEELAAVLGVTFAALNRWMNEKAVPRKKVEGKIDELYKEYTGEKQIPETELEAKKQIIFEKKKQHPKVLKEIIENPDILDQFYLSLTYHSNRIEGSKLTENETADILFRNIALPNRSLVEQLEAKNHQAALEYLFQHLSRKSFLNEALILKLHSILMNSIRSDAGIYRRHGVRIMGTYVPTANYLKVSDLMKNLIKDIGRKHKDQITHISEIHSKFEQIHPFADGNGRIGRLLMHAMAIKAGFAPVVVLQEKRRFYMTYLNKAQMKGDLSLLENFMCEAILKGFDILERKA